VNFLQARRAVPVSIRRYFCGRFRNDEPARGRKEGRSALGHHGRRSEGSGHDTRKEPSIQRVAATQLGPLVHHTHTGSDAERGHGSAEELRPTPIGLKKDDLRPG
jgi:hypothetical protein